MSGVQLVGWFVAGVAGAAFLILQIRMWRTVIAVRRLQRMIDDLTGKP